MSRSVEDLDIADFVDKVKSELSELRSCEPERLGIYLDAEGQLWAHTALGEWTWIDVKRTPNGESCKVDTSHLSWGMLVRQSVGYSQIFPLTFITPFDGARLGRAYEKERSEDTK